MHASSLQASLLVVEMLRTHVSELEQFPLQFLSEVYCGCSRIQMIFLGLMLCRRYVSQSLVCMGMDTFKGMVYLLDPPLWRLQNWSLTIPIYARVYTWKMGYSQGTRQWYKLFVAIPRHCRNGFLRAHLI